METNSLILKLISVISENNIFQAKALNGLADRLSNEEKDGLAALLNYYIKQGDTIEHLAECYQSFIQDIMEEQVYFVENQHYRYSSSGEVNTFFYQNPSFMEYYMKGLAVSTYLLDSHRKCRAWFCKKIAGLDKGKYWLDAGVGHGEYFQLAVRCTNYKHYLGIDISPACVSMTKEMIDQRVPPRIKSVEVKEQDFFQYDGPTCDAVVLGEILEHVEKPEKFLEKTYEITHTESFIYITTVVNCPQRDHIYLFKDVEEIIELYQNTGFKICDSLIYPTNGYTLEKAIKKKRRLLLPIFFRKGAGKRCVFIILVI